MVRKLTLLIGLLLTSPILLTFAPQAQAMAPHFQEAEKDSGLPWWVWLIILLILLVVWIVLLVWMNGRTRREKAQNEAAHETEAPEAAVLPAAAETEDEAEADQVKSESIATEATAEPETPAAAAPPVEPDDLKKIEGIGPKIAGLLQAAGINTFSQLATTDVSQLQQMMRDANLPIANPSTWPEQAQLAANGQWDQLETLQDSLTGGHST